MKLHRNDHVALVANSNPISSKEIVIKLVERLEALGLVVEYDETIFKLIDGHTKAHIMHKYYLNDDIKAIFDISGGDLANSIIDYLDYDMIKAHPKPLFGYSDLTCVLNAIYYKTDIPQVLYQVRNILNDDNYHHFQETFFENNNILFDQNYTFLQGRSIAGTVVGGNIRCFLKLAGTTYFPDLNHKILLLESFGGGSYLMYSYMNQLKQLGVFDKISGIMLGHFSEMESKGYKPTIVDIIKEYTDLPIVRVNIGHNIDSQAMIIGEKL